MYIYICIRGYKMENLWVSANKAETFSYFLWA